MQNARSITICSNKNKVVLNISTILYVLMIGNIAEIHVSNDKIYETRMTLSELSKMLGDGFIKAHRGCIVSVTAIHEITDKIYLSNGENLIYTLRKKNEILRQFREKQRNMIQKFSAEGIPMTEEDYHMHYKSFDEMPFAFTDIEMVFNDEKHAVDWIFRYGNQALARLEKLPLERLIGTSFGSLFANMDSKWLKNYERATLYGETLEIIDYSPEIDTYLKVICFPTFKGHCGCILFNIEEIELTRSSSDDEKALLLYFGKPKPAR